MREVLRKREGRSKGVEKTVDGVLGHNSTLLDYTGPGTTWANEMNFVMIHAPGAG